MIQNIPRIQTELDRLRFTDADGFARAHIEPKATRAREPAVSKVADRSRCRGLKNDPVLGIRECPESASRLQTLK